MRRSSCTNSEEVKLPKVAANQVFFQNQTSLRTLDKLYPLELSTCPDVSPVVSEGGDDVPACRPSREAARRAAAHRQILLQEDLL